MTLHGLENYAIHYVADGNDQNHDSDDSAHVVQVTAHHQHLPEAQAQIKHLSSDQRAPGKGPSLLQAGDDEGEAGWQKHMPEQLKTVGAEVAARHAENLGHLLAAV